MILGVTGKIATGKDSICNILERNFNFYQIKVDEIGHLALRELKDEIQKSFKNYDIIDKNGEISRPKLRNIVFKDYKELSLLESIVNPFIKTYVEEKLKSKNEKVLINAATLFNLDLHLKCNIILIVNASEDVIRERLKKRGIEEETINYILKTQKDIFYKRNLDFLKIIKVENSENLRLVIEKIKKELKL